MMFASKNVSNMKTASRRDDLISLCYLLTYLVDGDLPYIHDMKFDEINERKNKLTTRQLCNSPEGSRLFPFVNEIFKLKFEERPNYERLRTHLITTLSEIN
jgi:hypothetical protein